MIRLPGAADSPTPMRAFKDATAIVAELMSAVAVSPGIAGISRPDIEVTASSFSAQAEFITTS